MKYSGLVNDKSVGIVPAAGRGVVVSTRKQKVSPNAIKGSRNSTTVYVSTRTCVSNLNRKGGSRRVAGAVANMVAKNGYRADLRKRTYRHIPKLDGGS